MPSIKDLKSEIKDDLEYIVSLLADANGDKDNIDAAKDRLSAIIYDLSGHRQRTADDYRISRYSRVYYYSPSSTDGVPSIGKVCFRNGKFWSFYGPKVPIFFRRESVIEYIRSLGQVPADDRNRK